MVTADARPAEADRARKAGADSVLVKPTTPEAILAEMQRLLVQSPRLDAASITQMDARAAAQVDRSADPVVRSGGYRRTVLAKSHHRFSTTTPPMVPPTLMCPSCDRPLAYEQSHIGGVSEHHAEQWDYYVCSALCGRFQYRQRTRRLRPVA